jgi:hypothetical protein
LCSGRRRITMNVRAKKPKIWRFLMRRPKGRRVLRGLFSCSCALLLACSSTQTALRSSSSAADDPVPAGAARSSSSDVAVLGKARSLPLVYAAADTRHCDQLQIACFSRCWETYPPYPVERGNKSQYRYCTSQCLKEYMECVKNAEAHPRTFPNQMTALDWLEKHKTEVLVGTLLFVGGAAFIIGTGGAGALILIPVAAL